MTGKDLKIFSMFYIAEHDNLSKAQKLDLYEFVQRADTFSVMNFLTTGQPVYIPNRYRKNVVENFVSTKVGGILTEADDTMTAGEKARRAGHSGQTLSQAHDAENARTDAFAGREMGGSPESKYASTPEGSYNKPDSLGQMARDVRGAAEKGAADVAAWYKGGIESLASKLAATDTFGGAEGPTADKVAQIQKALNTGATGLGAAAVAALVGFLGYKIYKNYFSQAAKACKGAPDKKACMAKVRAGAISKAAATINSQKANCKKSADPAKCAAKLDAKLAKMRAKVGALKK